MSRALFVAAACMMVVLPAGAAAPDWGGSISLASNHLWRGISRSSNDPSLSAEVHVQSASGWFAGAWAASSRARAIDDTSVDVAVSAGFGGQLGSLWTWRGTAAHYQSPWQHESAAYRHSEFTLDVQLRDTLLLSASYSPDTSVYLPYPYLGNSPRRAAFAYELAVQRHLYRALRAHGGAGYRDLPASIDGNYWYGSVGLGLDHGRWHTDLSYEHPGRAARRVSWPDTARRQLVLRLSYGL